MKNRRVIEFRQYVPKFSVDFRIAKLVFLPFVFSLLSAELSFAVSSASGSRSGVEGQVFLLKSKGVLSLVEWDAFQFNVPADRRGYVWENADESILDPWIKLKRLQVSGQYPACVNLANTLFGQKPEIEVYLLRLQASCLMRTANAPEEFAAIQQWWKRFVKMKSSSSLTHSSHEVDVNRVAMNLLLVWLEALPQMQKEKSKVKSGIEFGMQQQGLLQVLESAERIRFWKALAKGFESVGDKSAAAEMLSRAPGGDDSASASTATAAVAGANSAQDEKTRVQLRNFENSKVWNEAWSNAQAVMRDAPVSARAKQMGDRIQEILISLAEKIESKSEGVVDIKVDSKSDAKSQAVQFAEAVRDADSDRVEGWAKILVNRGYYDVAYALTEKLARQNLDQQRTLRFVELAADSAFHTDLDQQAFELYKQIEDRFPAATSLKRALIRMGLVQFRRGLYQEARAVLQRYLQAFPGKSDNQELVARYWSWRALQKMGSGDQSKSQLQLEATQITDQFPYSYYGLRVASEVNGGKILAAAQKGGELQLQQMLTPFELLTFKRTQSLLKMGWLEEAQNEIAFLPIRSERDNKILRAQLWGAALNYQQAAKLMNEVWDLDRNLRVKEFLPIVFPLEFLDAIRKQASVRGVDPILVQSLIKQESAFHMRAVSTSNAMGLMQMIPPTAQEIATDLKIENLKLPEDMFQPQQNIRMGTYYLGKVLKKYNGYVPLALAAYNAGPTKVDRWMKSRKFSRAGWKVDGKNVNFQDEIWFDELPWDETSFYVKAILRNQILYQMVGPAGAAARSELPLSYDAGASWLGGGRVDQDKQ